MLLTRPANAITAENRFPCAKEKAGFSRSDPHHYAATLCKPTTVQLPARTIRSFSHHFPYASDKQLKHKISTGKKKSTTYSVKNYLSFIALLNLYQPLLADLRRRNI
jgi:hypothetical protein